MKKATVTIYSKPGCHLCDEAKANILAAGCDGEFIFEEINIESDPQLTERYKHDIPVVLINGLPVFKYFVDKNEFKRKLRRFTLTTK
jgi:glutaredoxin